MVFAIRQINQRKYEIFFVTIKGKNGKSLKIWWVFQKYHALGELLSCWTEAAFFKRWSSQLSHNLLPQNRFFDLKKKLGSFAKFFESSSRIYYTILYWYIVVYSMSYLIIIFRGSCLELQTDKSNDLKKESRRKTVNYVGYHVFS